MSAMGLGRVITLRLGPRADATGQLYGDAADLSNLLLKLDRRQPYARSGCSERRTGLRETLESAQGYALIAAISGLMPTIFITRVRL
jgi:hypothetical protein